MRTALLALCILVSCRSRQSAPSAKPEPSTATASSAQPAMAQSPSKTAPSASAAPVQRRAEPLDAQSQAALARARKLQAEGRFEEAKAEFLRASGAGQTLNLQPLVELGYLELKEAGGSDDDAEALALAGTTADDTTLEAQAWYNLSTLYARRSDAEAERAALARSLARRDNKTVAAKLGSRSRCVAEIGRRLVTSSPKVVTGWVEVGTELQLGSTDDTPAEARQKSCLESSFSAAEPDKSHGCPGAGPWETTFSYSWFSYQRGFIAPLAKDRFFVDITRVGSWPAICRGSVTPTWKMQGAYAIATLEADDLTQLPGRPIPQADPENGVCISSAGTTTTAVFAADLATLLAAVSVTSRHAVKVELDGAKKRLVLSGGNCDAFVALDGAFKLTTNSPR